MIIFNVSQSAYIFRQQIIVGIIAFFVCLGLLILLLIRLGKKLKLTNQKFRQIGLLILTIPLTTIIYLVFFFPSLKNTFKLENNGVETNGKTVQWINTNDSRMIEYSFTLNGQTFNKICDVVYSGQEIQNIVCPDGEYVVIYEKDNPNNSIMDFKRLAK